MTKFQLIEKETEIYNNEVQTRIIMNLLFLYFLQNIYLEHRIFQKKLISNMM